MTLTTSSKNLVWDAETNGLLPDVDKVWCIGVQDLDTGEQELFTDYDPTKRGLIDARTLLLDTDSWSNHNIRGYDIPVLEYLGWNLTEPSMVYDTLLISQILYPVIQEHKFAHRVPKAIAWSHSLEAWGYRLGIRKGSYDDWSKYTDKMGKYCLQDTAVTAAVHQHLKSRAEYLGIAWDTLLLPGPLAIEHEFKRYIVRQEQTGFPFDKEAAQLLVNPLVDEQEKINNQLQETFPPITRTVHYTTPKKKLKRTKEVTTTFNPASRKQVGERLISAGWEPTSFTANGQPVINEDTMAIAAKQIPEAELIDRYFTVNKRLGALVNGDNAWLRLERDGRIHGRVKTLGAVTTRVSHVQPNMSQVPAVGSYLGKECRALFHARKGWKLVGADLSGIELRCLAHYLTHWDDGEYIDHVLNGDVHTVHQLAFGLPEGKKYRGIGKGGTYCLIYGGGDWKLGWTLGATGSRGAVTKAGKRFRDNLMGSLPALHKLVNAVKAKRARGNKAGKLTIYGIAGHPLYCRAEHSAINTLLQGAGATIAKTWYVLFHRKMEELGYVYGEDYETYIFAHDEIQCGCRPELADVIGQILCETSREAGELLGMRIRIDAEYKVGFNWAETH